MILMIKYLLASIIVLIFAGSDLKAELCKDFMIWDGNEQVRGYGVDTTGNWWAMTAPYGNLYRLIVNGDQTEEFSYLYAPIFSRDGSRWATFAQINGTWFVLTNDELIELKATEIGQIGFSNDSQTLVYSYFISQIEYINLKNKTIEVNGKTGTFFTNNNGSMYAFVGMRGSRKVLNINGKETTTFDDILPIGFWSDNKFLYAAMNGNTWEIYKNSQSISENFNNVKEAVINHTGTVAAVIVETTAGFQTGLTLSDEYYEPLMGRNYDVAAYLTIHPELPLIAYFAKSGINSVIVMNSAEYSTYINTGVPMFSHDGEDLLFAACDFDCFLSVNGKRFTIKTNIAPQTKFAFKPGSNSVAYVTDATMIVMFLESQKMHAGMMVDQIIPPIFNRKTNRYETIGSISNRLYLMTCTTD